jgi:hydrogenase nickel incorporation protein HypB
MSSSKVSVIEKILSANDQIAELNRKKLSRVFSINLMASPGAGKTSLILKTIEALASKIKIGVIEGDTAPVTIDADKIISVGMPAVQINTGGDCHLDAVMLTNGLNQLPLDQLDLVIVENVGNLICPAAFVLGTDVNVLIASIPEGDDKPYKYPNIYRGIDALILNKTDLQPYVQFDTKYFQTGVEMLNPGVKIFPMSCKTKEGLDAWTAWLLKRIADKKSGYPN